MSFRESFNQKIDAEVAKIREDHPEFVTREIAHKLCATIWELRASLKRLGVVMREGRPPRRNPEN